MNCDSLSHQYSDAYEKQLSREEQQAFDTHLQYCASCQQDYQQFLEALQFLHAHKPTLDIPQTFTNQVMSASYQQLLSSRQFPRGIWGHRLLLSAILLFLIGTLFLVKFRSRSNPLLETPCPGWVYDGKQWLSPETFLAQSLTDPKLLETAKQHPQLQQVVREMLSGSQQCLEQEYLQLKQEGGLPQEIESFSRLQPELLETFKTHEMTSFLSHSSIGNGFFLQGFFFYPVFLEKDQQKSFLNLSSALHQGVLQISTGEETGCLQFQSFSTRSLIVHAGEILSTPHGDYLLKKTGVIPPQSTETFPVMAFATAPPQSSCLPAEVGMLPPSLLASLFSSEEVFLEKTNKLLNLVRSSYSQKQLTTIGKSPFAELSRQKTFQEHSKKLLQSIPYPKQPSPSGWFVVRQNQILYGEIFSDPDQMEQLFPSRIESLLLECAVRFGCVEHDEQRQNWPMMQNIFLHKQRLQHALQQVLSLSFQVQSLSAQMKLALLYPENPLGIGIAWEHQWIHFQLFQDPNRLETENPLSLSHQTLWEKLLQTENIELQEPLFQKLMVRISENEFQELWKQVSQTSDKRQQQIFLRLLLKKRPAESEKKLEQWLTLLWEQKTSFDLALQLIDALSLTKHTPAIPLLLKLLQSDQNPLKNRLRCLEALKILYPQASEDLQKRIQVEWVQWGKLLVITPDSEHSVLYQELLDVCAHISGHIYKDIDAYWELWEQ